jgi:TonB family protein
MDQFWNARAQRGATRPSVRFPPLAATTDPLRTLSMALSSRIMSMFWIAFAAQFSLPVPIGLPFPDVRAVFSPDDMPAYVQIAGINRFVATRTTVRPDGTVQDCTVEQDSGDAKLDAYTCAIIVRRAKFQPAKWVDGSTAYGVIRAPVIWAIGGPPSKSEVQKAYPPDIELSVTRLPAGADRRTSLALMIVVDENGRVVGCDERPKVPRDHTKTFPELVPIACQQMMNEFTAVPAKDASGKPVRSVQTASVVFSTGT